MVSARLRVRLGSQVPQRAAQDQVRDAGHPGRSEDDLLNRLHFAHKQSALV
jgi:hypothetical protein